MRSQNGKCTIYTEEKRKILLHNAANDPAVAAAAESYRQKAEALLPHTDALYGMIVAEGLFRYYYAGPTHDPNRTTCRYCGEDMLHSVGLFGWKVDPLNHPWKVICPCCGRLFPSNDFGSYYKLGLDQQGIFHKDVAQEKHIALFGGLIGTGYLKNGLYPEMEEHTDENGNTVNPGIHNWGVDDGFGLENVNADSFPQGTAYYIPLYIYNVMHGHGSHLDGTVFTALQTFRDAYLYTGDIRYGRAGAILLDRMADVYPTFDWAQWMPLRQDEFHGTIADEIQGTFMATFLAECCDAFYPACEDPEVIAYLSARAKAMALSNPKATPEDIRCNWEEGILRQIFRFARSYGLSGNFGMVQACVATAAVVLNTLPETQEYLDWLMAANEVNHGAAHDGKPRAGGNLLAQLVDIVDRDGMGNESAPGYNRHWLQALLNVAKVLEGYALYPSVDLYKNPKFLKMFYSQLPVVMGGYYTAQIGDLGSCCGLQLTLEQQLMLPAFIATGDPVFAQAMYLMNGRTAKGLRYPDTVKDPSRLEAEVEAIIAARGELDCGSTQQSGYGLYALRKGKQDFWVYSGSTAGHGHSDGLNLGLDAFGLNLGPELGYPRHTGPDENRIQWVCATISHNTVVVDEESQDRYQDRGQSLHFADSGRVRLMDVDKHKVYPQTDVYRRTVVMVDVEGQESYGVDFFRILGGKNQLYSFHSQSHEIAETQGLNLVPQKSGTYAGADVPYGQDPSPLSGYSWDHNVFTYPDGYTWLDRVQRDTAPTANFAIDFKITDYLKVLDDPEGIHLRLTVLDTAPLDDVAIADGYPPKTAQNPQPCLKYALIRKNSSDTLFAAVLEPYRNTRYIKDIALVSLTRADGKALTSQARGVKVTHLSGREDYILWAEDNTQEYRVDDRFSFRGFVGVATFEAGENTYAWLCDGDILTNNLTGKLPAFTGKVSDFTRELAMENTVTVTLEQPAQEAELKGNTLYVTGDGERSSVYEILEAKALTDGTWQLNIGNTTPIRCYRDKYAPEQGYVYDIAPGAELRIPLTWHT